jgi:hypothetical protein
MNFLFKTLVSQLWCNLTVFWGYQESFPHGRQRAGFKNLKKKRRTTRRFCAMAGLSRPKFCLTLQPSWLVPAFAIPATAAKPLWR